MPFELQERVEQYFEYTWAQHKGFNEEILLKNEFPPALQIAIVRHVTEDMILSNPVFTTCKKNGMNMNPLIYSIVAKLQQEIFCSHDTIILPRDPRMVLLEKGDADVVTEKGQVVRTITSGDSFDVIALFWPEEQHMLLRGVQYCETWILGKREFDSIVQTLDGETQRNIVNAAEQYKINSASANIAKNLGKAKLSKVFSMKESSAEAHTRRIFQPDSRVQRLWNLLMLAILLYILIYFPVRTCFHANMPVDATIIFDYFVDVLLWIDIFLRWTCFAYDDGWSVVTKPEEIARTYKDLWAAKDIASSIPFDIIYYILAFSGVFDWDIQLLATFRLNRMLRLFRLRMYLHSLEEWMNTRYVAWRIVKLIAAILLSAHIFGSAFYFLGTKSTGGWLDANELRDESLLTNYIISVYWGVTTLTTVGYGDIVPTSQSGMIFTTFILVAGGIMYSVVVADLDEIVAQSDITTILFQMKTDELKQYLIWRRLPVDVRARILKHAHHLWLSNKGVDDDRILSFLTPSLRSQVIGSLVDNNIILNVPILGKLFSDNINALYRMFQAETYQMGDFLYIEGEVPENIYFIYRGKVDMISDTGLVYKSCVEGMVIGDGNFFLQTVFDCGARAATPTNVFLLSYNRFFDWLATRPDKERLFGEEMSRPQVQEELQERASVESMKANLQNTKLNDMLKIDQDRRQKTDGVIYPNALARRLWDVLQLALIVYNAATVPYKIAFAERKFSDASFWIPTDILVDILVFLEVIFMASIFARYDRGVLLRKRSDIFSSFIRRQAVFEIISLLPLDWIFYATGDVTAVYLARALRLIRLRHVNQYFESMVNALDERKLFIYIYLFFKKKRGLFFSILLFSFSIVELFVRHVYS